ncbi:MAG: radical SAM protein [Polyangiaceae bacterium]|nr:radical SAM protein [Polyangiaceae bacterium]
MADVEAHPHPALVPVVALLRTQTASAAKQFLRIPSDCKLTSEALRATSHPGLLLRVTHPSMPDLELELSEHQPNQRSFATNGNVQLSYRKLRDGQDPLNVRATALVLQRVKLALQSLEATQVASLRESLQQSEGYAGVEDWMYRYVTPVGSLRREGHVRLGFRCNQDCGFCWQSRRWPDPPSDACMQWIDGMADAGITNLVISGGEPTLYRALPEVIRHACFRRKMEVTLETNAIRCAKPQYTQQLAEAGLRHAFVSYHSADAEVSDSMTRAPGTHGRTEQGILELMRHGVYVILNCVVDSRNVNHLQPHAQRILEHFLPEADGQLLAVTYSHPSSYFDAALFESTTIDLDRARAALAEAIRLLLDQGVTVVADGSCGFPPCTFTEVPSVLRLLAPETFSAAHIAGHVFHSECDRCAMRPHCLGFRSEYVNIHGMRGIRPFVHVPPEARPASETLTGPKQP